MIMKKILFIIGIALAIQSCTTTQKSIKNPASYVELERSDFTLSEQKSATAKSASILIFQITGSDKTATDNLDRVTMPIVGQYLTDKTTANAMYKLLEENSDADFIFYPQVEKRNTCPILGICLLYRHTEVEVKSKLGTFK